MTAAAARTPGALNDVVGTSDRDDWPPTTDPDHLQVREAIRAGLCPWCTGTRADRRGPWVSIAAHVSQAHGVDRYQLREAAGLFRHSVVCSDAHHHRLRQRALIRGTRVQGGGQGGGRVFSKAGRASQAAKLAAVTPAQRAAAVDLRTPEQRSAQASQAAAASGAVAAKKAAQRPLFHGTAALYSDHKCRCELCQQYRRWVRKRGPRPEPAPAVRPCHHGCETCRRQQPTQQEA